MFRRGDEQAPPTADAVVRADICLVAPQAGRTGTVAAHAQAHLEALQSLLRSRNLSINLATGVHAGMERLVRMASDRPHPRDASHAAPAPPLVCLIAFPELTEAAESLVSSIRARLSWVVIWKYTGAPSPKLERWPGTPRPGRPDVHRHTGSTLRLTPAVEIEPKATPTPLDIPQRSSLTELERDALLDLKLPFDAPVPVSPPRSAPHTSDVPPEEPGDLR